MSARGLRFAVAAAAGGLAALFACSTPPSDSRVVASVPDRASFAPVADLLVHSCGTLDCHGTKYRNLRLYGSTGLRYALTDHPSANAMTTSDEADQDFASIVGLEPEIMTQVVTSGGAAPERLTFIRKARGSEEHKGGVIVKPGDDQDVCLTTWLKGSADANACARAIAAP